MVSLGASNRLLACVATWYSTVAAVAESEATIDLAQESECKLEADGQCPEAASSFIQLRRGQLRNNGSCEGEAFTSVARHIRSAVRGAPPENKIIAAFRHGCDPTLPAYSSDCPAVKASHSEAYFHTLEKLNRAVGKFGAVSMSFDDFVMVSLHHCMWQNRHNPGDQFGDDPFDTCTPKKLCSMITTRADFEKHLPLVSLEAQQHRLGRSMRTPTPGWPGTGKAYQMVRVSLLHLGSISGCGVKV